MVFAWTSKEKEYINHAALRGQTTFGSCHTRKMLRDLIEEASRWDLEPELVSLWWTSTYDSEEKSDMNLGTTSGCYTFPFENKFKILSRAMNRQGKTYDALEERMQSATKAFWKDSLIFKSKDVPWKIKCQRLVDHVNAEFAFWSENLSWTVQTMEKIKRWETKRMTRLFRLKRQKEETCVDYRKKKKKTCNVARKMGADGPALPAWNNCRKHVACHGMGL